MSQHTKPDKPARKPRKPRKAKPSPKVVGLDGKPVLPTGVSCAKAEAMLKTLRWWDGHVRSGQVVAMVVVTVGPDGSIRISNDGVVGNRASLVGALVNAQHEICATWDNHPIEPEAPNAS